MRDVAFPVLNSVRFWLTAAALLINASLVIGKFARTGWVGYLLLSELAFSPDVGCDYYLWREATSSGSWRRFRRAFEYFCCSSAGAVPENG